jgi:C_GCAxxG_C_C family probable redox protein
MTKIEKAVDLSYKGFNCSQSVFHVFAEENGVDEKAALRVACAFGGGMARTAGICGAVTGAMMAIGLKHGMDISENQDARMKTYELSRKFFEEFKTLHGTLICKDLIGFDIGNPEQIGIAANSPEFKEKMNKCHDEICSKLIADAVKITEKLI